MVISLPGSFEIRPVNFHPFDKEYANSLISIPILGLTIHNEKTLFRVVNTLVIAGLITWLALLAITYFSPTMQHF